MDDDPLPAGARAAIVAQLPDDWSEEEINHFLETYADQIEHGFEGEVIDEVDTTEPEPAPEPAQVLTLEQSAASRNGLTLDTHIIVDGRSVPLRAIAEAGQLYPYTRRVHEGTKRHPRPRVQYEARLIDRPRTLIITEETFRALHPDFAQIEPHPEDTTEEQVEALQATVTVVEADKMERTFKR